MLEQVDLSLKLTPEEYKREVDDLQDRLHLLGLEAYRQKR